MGREGGMRWYICRNGETVGPSEGAVLIELAREGKLHTGCFVRDEQGGSWMPIENSPFMGLVRGGLARRPITAFSGPDYKSAIRDSVFWGVVMASFFLGVLGALFAVFVAASRH